MSRESYRAAMAAVIERFEVAELGIRRQCESQMRELANRFNAEAAAIAAQHGQTRDLAEASIGTDGGPDVRTASLSPYWARRMGRNPRR